MSFHIDLGRTYHHTLALAVILVGAGCLALILRRKKSNLLDFDGPSSYPLIGSLLSLKGRLIVEACEEDTWNTRFGPVIKFFVGVRPCLLVTSAASARELFSRAETEGRPMIPFFAKELGAFETITPMMAAHGQSKAHIEMLRRSVLTCHRALLDTIGQSSSQAALSYLLNQQSKSKIVDIDYLVAGLARLNFMEVAYSQSLGTIEAAMSDEKLNYLLDKFVELTNFLNSSHEYSVPFPALEWLLPLRSRRLRAEATVLRETWNSASQQMATLVLGQYPEANRGNGWSGLPESIFKQCLLSGKVTEEQALRTSCGIALASMDTTSSSMKTVLTAFAYFKDLQRTHQECLDRVCDGIPTEHSETAYPEMLAFIRECLRIVPAIPIGIIRETISDMEWRGRKIPAGTLLFPMVQMINRDVDLYGADALEFRPSRFFESLGQNGKGLNSKGTSQLGPLTSQAGFGFGKRACPGADLAEKAIAMTVSRLLYCFDIEFEDPTIVHRQSFFETLNVTRDSQVRQVRPPPLRFTLRKDEIAMRDQLVRMN